MRMLLATLSDGPMPLLRGIAEVRGVSLRMAQPLAAAEQLAAALSQVESVEQAIADLPEEARQALGHLVSVGGRMTLAAFSRMAGCVRTFGVSQLEETAPWRNPINAAEALWYRALIGRTFADTPTGPVEFIYIPTDILPLLGNLPAPPLPTLRLTPIDAPANQRPAATTWLDDVCTLLIYVYQQSPRQTGNRWRERGWRALQAQLIERDLAGMTLRLAGLLGWVQTEGERLRLASDQAFAWLDQPRPIQAQSLFTTWRDDTVWNDLWHVPSLRCIEAGWRNDPYRARRVILDYLRRAVEPHAATAWFSLNDFIQAIKTVDPDFQRPDGNYQTWYIQDIRTGVYLRGFESWEQVEGALITYLLTEPLRALGMVQLGTVTTDAIQPDAFRLTLLGRWLLGLETELPAFTPPRLHVADNFMLTLPAGYPLLDRFRVARFAAPMETATPTPPWRYQIRQTSLAKAQQQGLTIERILDYLRAATGDALPANVQRALAQLSQPLTAQVRRTRLIEASPRLAAQLRKEPTFSPYLMEGTQAEMLLVDEADWPAARAALHRLGVARLSKPPSGRGR